jgi:hypothetical protein
MSLERLKKGMILSQRDPSDLSSAERTEAMLFYTSEIHGSLMSIWGSMNQDGMKTETDTFRNLEELKKQIDSLADSVQTPPNDGKWDYEVYKERGQNFIPLLCQYSKIIERIIREMYCYIQKQWNLICSKHIKDLMVW